MSLKKICVLAFVLVSITSQLSQWEQIIQEEDEFRKKINMTFDHYHAYPFPIKDSQDYILQYSEAQKVTSEIFVYWIGPQNTLLKPKGQEYEKQYINLKIEREDGLMVFEKKFYTQSAFKFLAEPKTKYRVRFQNNGEQIKMVDFSISYIVPTVNEEVLTEDSQLKIDPLVDEIKGLFHHWEQNLLIKQEEEEEKTGKFRKFLMYTTWEIALIVGLMLAQVFAIKKITNDYSII